MSKSAIVDQFGRTIEAKAFDRPRMDIATISDIRHWEESVATGLNPQTLAQILRDNDCGHTLDMLTLAVEMEERDLHYFSQVQTRKNAISGAEMVVEPGDDSAKGQEIADAWEEYVVETPEFRWMLDDMNDAITKSYSVIQPIFDTTTRPWTFKDFEHHDPRCFHFDIYRKRDLRVRVLGKPEGDDLPPGLLVHYPRIRTGIKLRGGIARLAAINYLFKVHSVADWLAFAEVYGMPIRTGRYNPNTATDDEKADMRRALVNMGHDAAMMIPEGMDIKIEDARRPTSGDNLFSGMAEYFDEQTSKAINGITTAGDAKAQGIGTGESTVHKETRQDIKRADSLANGASIRTLCRMWVAFNYGIGAPVPKTKIVVDPPEDLAAKATTWKGVGDALTAFKTAGKLISNELVQEEFGIEVEDAPEPTAAELAAQQPQPGKPGAKKGAIAPNAANLEPLTFVDEATAGLLANWEELMSPHLKAIEDAARASGDYEDLDKRLKKLATDIDSDPLVREMAKAAMKARGEAAAAK